MNKKYPKILIIGETFHQKTGGGITLTNLFSSWPKESLFNACASFKYNTTNSDRCSEYYQFGELENHFYFPKIITKRIPHPYLNDNSKSGVIDYNSFSKFSLSMSSESRGFKLKKIFRYISFLLGVYPLFPRKRLSTNFINWIEKTKPDYIYTQLSDIDSIRFIKQLTDKTKIPLCIHVMDDWPTTYAKPGLLYYYWKKRINIEFRQLLERAKILLSISEGMSGEYLKRYNKVFIPFHNPVDLDFWFPNRKTDFTLNKENIRVLYSGRIGIGTSQSLLDVIKAISRLRKKGVKITIELQVPVIYHKLYKKYVSDGTVIFNPFVEYNKIPLIFSKVDILILPYDFNYNRLKFIKYSMPTKASEYMSSGTPILLYADSTTYLSQNATKYEWAHVINRRSIAKLIEELLNLIEREDMRLHYSQKALHYSSTNFNAETVRNRFWETFNN